jgi:hypothetical protein
MLLIFLSIVAFVLTTRLWKWYDSILNAFSSTIRVLDIFTWGLVLWFMIVQYKKKVLAFPQASFWTSGFGQYCNIYTWCGLTVIGFIIIGFLRLFIKNNLFNK